MTIQLLPVTELLSDQGPKQTIKFIRTRTKTDLSSSTYIVLNKEYPKHLKRQHTLKWEKDILFVHSKTSL